MMVMQVMEGMGGGGVEEGILMLGNRVEKGCEGLGRGDKKGE